MPNLEHDPQNPTDLLGRPIHEGNIVAWGTTFGKSAALCIAVIEQIRFTREDPTSSWKPPIVCEQKDATDYKLRLVPIKSTGWTTETEWDPVEKKHVPLPKPKSKLITHVKNVVLLEPMDLEDRPAWLR
jgi:hypothetical protein